LCHSRPEHTVSRDPAGARRTRRLYRGPRPPDHTLPDPGDGRAPPRRPPDRLSVEDTHPLSVVPGRGICGARLCVCALRFGGYGVGVTHTRSPVREKDIQLNFEADRQGLKCLPFLEPN